MSQGRKGRGKMFTSLYKFWGEVEPAQNVKK